MAAQPYEVEYDPQALEELRALRRFDQVKVVNAIDKYLVSRPAEVKGATIKKLDPPVLASFRLRVGDLRVFYDVVETERIVRIIAIREKGRKTLGETAHDPRD